jgi:thiol-disulfide isomerase/thioredoxin
MRGTITIAVIGLSGLFLSSCAPADVQEDFATSAPVVTVTPDASETTQPSAGVFISLADYQASPANYSGTKVVLFFNASWCSTCKVARDNFQASLSEIPGDMTIVEVDFDDSQDLRVTYGVTIQHTFVQIDDNGGLLKKWSGSTTIDDLVTQTA